MFISRMKISLVLLISATQLSISPVQAFAPFYEKCPEHKFSCDDKSQCIPKQWTCDGAPDCDDGSDEKEELCMKENTRNCTSSEFRCDVTQCIPIIWKCDGKDDCSDKTDEKDCTHKCEESEFKCANNGNCISGRWKCDGFPDCSDNSDEVDCEASLSDKQNSSSVLGHTYFFCKDGFRIPESYKCDGDNDCLSGEDEQGCGTEPVTSAPRCRTSEFQCNNLAYCISTAYVCDGKADCEDAEDEKNCPNNTCSASEFKCGSGECVAHYERCDGSNDCVDRSDEQGCDIDTVKKGTDGNITVTPNCNETTHFQCSSGECISRDKLCNNRDDCGNDEDESVENCGVNECLRNNGGCQHECHDTREGYECSCKKGYRLMGKYTCEDINECEEIPGSCSQLCINTDGSFHCSCQPGYLRDPRDYKRCKAAQGEAYLIFSHSYDIRSIRLRDSDMTSVVSDTHGATALDFHYSQNQILWSDRKEKKIFRANMANTNSREVLVAEKEVSADGLAVDWIHGNIYYTDTNSMSVRMVSWDHKYSKSLISDNVNQPRSIVVSPSLGYIYWSDWGIHPKIERAGLDGSKRQEIIGHPHVAWPNGITIDHSTDRLYWCDGRLNTISSSNLDGSHVEVILFSPTVLRLPYSITVFEDRMYWTDWSKLALYSANKFNGNDVRNVSAGHILESPKVVHVFHKYRQPESENVCEDHPCSHICVRSTYSTALCVCPDGFLLGEDTFTCFEEGKLETNPELEVSTERLTYSPASFRRRNEYESKKVTSEPESPPEEIIQYISPPHESNWKPILGITAICLATIAVIAGMVILFIYLRSRRPRQVKRFRFHNPVYRKTTDDEADDGRGFTIAQEQLFYNPTREYQAPDPTLTMTEADDAPLAPEDDSEA